MKINKLNEEFQVHTLNNGLTVYLYNNSEFTNLYANYTVDFGSIDTEYEYEGKLYNDPKGIAHYLEHLMFADGSNDYFDYFSALGAQSNAYTSFNQTSYLFNGSSNYKQALKLLIEMVQTLKIDQARVEQEFGVIKEEIEMYASKPNFVLQNMLFSQACTSNYKHDIAGSIDSISEITYDHIKRLFEMFYAPSNATLFIAGNIDFDIEAIEQLQVITENKPRPVVHRAFEQLTVNSEFNYESSKVASEAQMMIGKKMKVCADVREMILADISFEIFSVWLTSDLNPNYSQAIEDGILNETFNGYHMLDQTINMLVFKMRSDQYQNVDDYIHNQVKTLNNDIIEVIKRKKIGSEIRLFNNPENICEYGLDLVLRDIDMNQYFEYLYDIDSNQIANYIESQIAEVATTVQILANEVKEVK